MLASLVASQSRAESLTASLDRMDATTAEALRCCEMLTKRARQLDSLTSPASDASSTLSRANANLAATLALMRDAREKFDTIADCEPSISRLDKGVSDLEENRQQDGGKSRKALKNKIILTEQDVYAAGDSIEILRDAFEYFSQRSGWRSAPAALQALERLHKQGTDAMCALIIHHLKKAGQAVRPRRNLKKELITPPDETAQQTRTRLAAALQNRDLLKSIGEFEEYQPIEARPIREIRAMFDCLASHGYRLGPVAKFEAVGLQEVFGIPANKVVRTEKVGSGSYVNLLKVPLKTGFPQLDAYGEARKDIAYASLDSFYRRVKAERKKKLDKAGGGDTVFDEADAAARDAVRCLEHAMIVAAGEKNVYRTVVAPSLSRSLDYVEDEETSPFFKKACVGAYAHIVGTVVDRTLDIIETVFLKEGGIGQTSGTKAESKGLFDSNKGTTSLTVRAAASAAAAGLRMLDGVRMLGPSLAKLCEMQVGDGITDANSSIAAILCIAIHRTTVKNSARTLENLAKAIQDDEMKGSLSRPKDASVSIITKDVIQAIGMISPFVSAYKSVSKRRALPWDPNMGDEAGELDTYVRFLVMRLLNALRGGALQYTKEGRDDSQAKSNLFLMNNSFYLLEKLGPDSIQDDYHKDEECYRIEGSWFADKIGKVMDQEKSKYVLHWEALNTHLTAVPDSELKYEKNDPTMLTHDCRPFLKQRFDGFNEGFERTYALHRKLCVIDPRLRQQLQQDVMAVFLPRYRRFYEKYTKIKFSKKHQEEYTKYSGDKIEEMLGKLYVDTE